MTTRRSRYCLGSLAGLSITADQTALIGSFVLWIILSAIAFVLLQLDPLQAILGALLAVLLHWSSEFVHHLGHAWAARHTGYPMRGIRLWWLLALSKYPRDEPPLPASVHIRRALGGPFFSAILTLLAGVAALALQSVGGLPWYFALFLFLDNLLVFTLGSFLPLGFTDGSTVLKYIREM